MPPAGELALERAAHVALQRPGAELVVEAVARHLRHEVVGDRQLDPALRAQPLRDARADRRGDPLHVLGGERVERHRLVDPVEELGQERLTRRGVHAVLGRRRLGGGEADAAPRAARAQVRRHDDHRVREVHGASLAVGQAAVVHDLQEHVPDLRVRLLDLVEQHHGVRAPTHRLGQLAAVAVADVAGRRPDQPRHRVRLAVLGHVDPHERLLGPEQPLGERLHQLGLADAGGAQEQERPQRLVAAGQADAGAPHGVGDDADGGVLAHDALVQVVLERVQPLELAGDELADRDAGARRDHRGDVRLGDDALAGRHGLAERREALLELVGAPLELRGVLVRLVAHGGRLLVGQVSQLTPEPVGLRVAAAAQAHLGGRLVDQVDRLVRQVVLADVAVRQPGRGEQRLVGDPRIVVKLVALAQPAQDLDGVVDRRLLDHDGREPPRERRIALDLAELGQRRGADQPQLAARQHRLEHVRGVHRALGVAGSEDRVQLVDEQHDLALGLGDLLERGLQALLELAAELAPGDHAGEVERDDAAAAEALVDVAGRDPQGQALGDRGLADAGLADQHDVVLAPAGEGLDRLLDLGRAADHGVDPARGRVGRQVVPEVVERRGLARGRLRGLRDGHALELRIAPRARLADGDLRPRAGVVELESDGRRSLPAGRADRASGSEVLSSHFFLSLKVKP
jgi:hypothetical protein